MEELISKAQAINAIEAEKIKCGSYLTSSYVGYEIAEKVVAKLSSAEPQIIRCKDCIFWTKQEDSLQGRCALLQMYPTGEWFCGNARRREVTE